jgi:hypothetical protein
MKLRRDLPKMVVVVGKDRDELSSAGPVTPSGRQSSNIMQSSGELESRAMLEQYVQRAHQDKWR